MRDLTVPNESQDRWPTYNNNVKGTPRYRDDPSLLTVDFCHGQPAVRGWQLNFWLKKLNRKGIRVVVFLDSCHSGGSWRAVDGVFFRTPNDCTTILNLDSDIKAAEDLPEDESTEQDFDAAELKVSWPIDPKLFTLMAACGRQERAAERMINGETSGAFTHELLECLRNDNINMTTYNMIRDWLTNRLQGQTPEVEGGNGLLFLGNSEPLSSAPLIMLIMGDRVIIPVEFILSSFYYGEKLVVDKVEEFECSAVINENISEQLEKSSNVVFPSRWSLGDKTLSVYVDDAFDNSFRETLQRRLESRIASPVNVIKDDKGSTDVLRLEKKADQVQIWDHGQFVTQLNLRDYDIAKLAAESAVIFVHLARFRSIVEVRANSASESAPFKIPINAIGGRANNNGHFPLDQKFKFEIKNIGEEELYFTVLDLSPEFSIEQLLPAPDHPHILGRGGRFNFHFSMKERPLSWKSLEMPEVWNAGKIHDKAITRQRLNPFD
ncbi:caspase domain-containing protein [Trichoderma evansii]